MHGLVKKYRGAMHDTSGLSIIMPVSFSGTSSHRLGELSAEVYASQQFTQGETSKYYMSTSLTVITLPFRAVKARDPYEVILFPLPTEQEYFLLQDRQGWNYFVRDRRG
jgi:hypothetical protein